MHDTFIKDELAQLAAPARKLTTLESSNHVGIIFDGTNPADCQVVLHFAEKLLKKGKKVRVLAYSRKKPEYSDFRIQFFSDKDLDFFLRPNSYTVSEFVNQPFDLLLNLTNDVNNTLHSIAAHSKARFRVGPNTTRTYSYDLMLECEQSTDIEQFLNQVLFYLRKLKPQYEPALAV
ncbi:MAG: hypothetical protein RLY31_632 [Bacteroidota bacterium]